MPYVIDPDVPNPQRILDGIAHWNTRTPFQIVPRTTEANYVHFSRSTTLDAACSSYLGMIGGSQAIMTTDACSAGSVIHELGHAWGLEHEQVRADRNGNVTVLYQNMDKRFIDNFDQQLTTSRDTGYYDFDSIMHYGRHRLHAQRAGLHGDRAGGNPDWPAQRPLRRRYRRNLARLRLHAHRHHDHHRSLGPADYRRWRRRHLAQSPSIGRPAARTPSPSTSRQGPTIRAMSSCAGAMAAISATPSPPSPGQTVFCAIYPDPAQVLFRRRLRFRHRRRHSAHHRRLLSRAPAGAHHRHSRRGQPVHTLGPAPPTCQPPGTACPPPTPSWKCCPPTPSISEHSARFQ